MLVFFVQIFKIYGSSFCKWTCVLIYLLWSPFIRLDFLDYFLQKCSQISYLLNKPFCQFHPDQSIPGKLVDSKFIENLKLRCNIAVGFLWRHQSKHFKHKIKLKIVAKYLCRQSSQFNLICRRQLNWVGSV